jgi:hypothetical protein
MRTSFFSVVLILAMFVLHGCSSVATSSLAYLVSSHAEKEAKRNYRFSAINRCILPEQTDAFALAQAIELQARSLQASTRIPSSDQGDSKEGVKFYSLSGSNIDVGMHDSLRRLLNRKEEGADLEKYPLGELAYAYYDVAFRLQDSRALSARDGIISVSEKRKKDLKEFLRHRYLLSFLEKCFYVPYEYHDKATTRERIWQRLNRE